MTTRISGVLPVAAALLAIVAVLAGLLIVQRTEGADAPASSEPAPAAEPSLVERGKYLADAGNCVSCHTREGGSPFAGGVAFTTPFGVLYSTNITPDRETGIGNWSNEDLRRAMHEGVAPGGRRLYPAFPYPSYTKVTDEDIDAIHAYLQTLDAVSYTPPDNGILFSQRWVMRIWNALFLEQGRFEPDPAVSPQLNRGAYLVDGLAHCGACHTPRNRFMAEIKEKAHQGGVIPDHAADGKIRDWFAVNLTGAANGLATWSEQDLTRYLHVGFSRRAGTFGPMNEVIVNSLSKLSAEDVAAMAAYIKSLPAAGEYTGAPVSPQLVEAGQPIYAERCEKCHGESGRGGIFSGPPLAGSAIVQSENPASLLNVILHGPEMPDEVSFGQWETMSSYADVLSDADVAALANYFRGSWDNHAREVSVEEVARQR